VLDAGYLAFEHLTASATLACSESGIVNCAKVTTSSYSTVGGIPVAFLGLGYFVVMAVLCSPVVYRAARPQLRLLRLGAAATGVVMMLYLLWVELFALDAICLWCTGVHVFTLVMFAAVVFESTESSSEVRGTSDAGAEPA
jgi:uncharacterized membrane protein